MKKDLKELEEEIKDLKEVIDYLLNFINKKKLKDKEIDEFLFNHPNMKRNLKEIGEL